MSPPLSTPGGLIRINAVALVSYAVTGALTLYFGQYSGLASPIWPAAGIAFALVYAWGWRVLPGIVLGSVLSNVATLVRLDETTTEVLAVTLIIGLGAAAQAAVSAILVVKAVGPRASLTRGGQIISFLLLAGVVGTVVSATIATITQTTAGISSADAAMSLWLTWWVGDSLGVLVFAPIALMLIPDQRTVWHGRRWRVAVPGLVVAALFSAFFAQTQARVDEENRLQVEQLATTAAGELERNVARHREVLEGLSSFFESSEKVTPTEFARYTESALQRFPNLAALSWNPLVPAEELTTFEAEQRELLNLNDYTVVERNADGEMVPVEERDYYVPVGYIEPLVDNQAALGFDINSNPVRAQAINRALGLGIPAATAPIDLVQETESQKGMLALVPAIQGDGPDVKTAGFAVGVYRLGDLLEDTFSGAAWDAVDIELIDVTQPNSPEEVADRQAIRPPTVDIAPGAGPHADSDRFTVFGRTWQLSLTPTSGPLAERAIAANAGLAVVGLLVIFLLQSFVLLVTGLERQAIRNAARSEEVANTDELTGLDNRRSFLANLARVRERSTLEGTVDALMFLDLDRFKSVNDIGGHDAGDGMLRSVARVLRDSVRGRDVVARIGGDEFAIILNSCPSERALQIGTSLVSAVEGIRVPGPDGALSIGLSVGIAQIRPDDGLGVDELIRQADDACYVIKRAGGGAHVYTGGDHSSV